MECPWWLVKTLARFGVGRPPCLEHEERRLVEDLGLRPDKGSVWRRPNAIRRTLPPAANDRDIDCVGIRHPIFRPAVGEDLDCYLVHEEGDRIHGYSDPRINGESGG
jgi:hypothetical protein